MTWLAEVNSGETGEKGLVVSGEKLFQASGNFSYQSELKASVQTQGRDNREENQQSSNLFDAPASFHPAWNARNLLCQLHSCSLDRAHSMHGPWIFVTCNGAWCIEISLKHFECLQALKDAFDRWFLKFYIHPNGPEVVIYSLQYIDSLKTADWHVERRHGATKRFALRCFCHTSVVS